MKYDMNDLCIKLIRDINHDTDYNIDTEICFRCKRQVPLWAILFRSIVGYTPGRSSCEISCILLCRDKCLSFRPEHEKPQINDTRPVMPSDGKLLIDWNLPVTGSWNDNEFIPANITSRARLGCVDENCRVITFEDNFRTLKLGSLIYVLMSNSHYKIKMWWPCKSDGWSFPKY